MKRTVLISMLLSISILLSVIVFAAENAEETAENVTEMTAEALTGEETDAPVIEPVTDEDITTEDADVKYEFNEKNGTLTLSGEGKVSSEIYEPYVSKDAIKKIVIGSGIVSIGARAFSGCGAAAEINLPATVEIIGEEAFSDCASLKSVTLPDSVIEVGELAFSGCSKLSNIKLSRNLQTIRLSAFDGCEKLTKLALPKSVSKIYTFCEGEFSEIEVDRDNENYASKNGNLYSKDMTVLYRYANRRAALTFTVPETVAAIEAGAFYGSRLVKIILPDQLEMIGELAFAYCEKLQSISIPDSVYGVGSRLFYSCDSLEEAYFGIGVSYTGDNMFENCRSLKKAVFTAEYAELGSYIFKGCASLKAFTITDNIASVNDDTFCGCTALETLIVENDRIELYPYLLRDCRELADIVISDDSEKYVSEYGVLYSYDKKTLLLYAQGKTDADLTIPEFVEDIGERAFLNSRLKRIYIPGSVDAIGAYAFENSDVEEIVFLSKAPAALEPDSFYGAGEITARYGKYDFSFEKYTDKNCFDNVVWAPYTPDLTDEEKKGECPGGLVWEYDEVTKTLSITGNGGMEAYEAGKAPWYHLSHFTENTVIGEGAVNISENAFYGFGELKTLTLPSVRYIGSGAFEGCGKLERVNYSGSEADWLSCEFRSADANPMFWAKKLYIDGKPVRSFTVPEEISVINDHAFSYIDGLEEIIIKSKLTAVFAYAFSDCPDLKTITFLSDPPELEQMFYAAVKDLSVTVNYPGGDAWRAFPFEKYENVKWNDMSGGEPQTTEEEQTDAATDMETGSGPARETADTTFEKNEKGNGAPVVIIIIISAVIVLAGAGFGVITYIRRHSY